MNILCLDARTISDVECRLRINLGMMTMEQELSNRVHRHVVNRFVTLRT
jgi:hypothetical protein